MSQCAQYRFACGLGGGLHCMTLRGFGLVAGLPFFLSDFPPLDFPLP